MAARASECHLRGAEREDAGGEHFFLQAPGAPGEVVDVREVVDGHAEVDDAFAAQAHGAGVWLRGGPAARVEHALMAVLRAGGGDGQVGVGVDGGHVGGFRLPVQVGVLLDAQGVDPEISDAELAGDYNCVFERLWQR